MNIIKKLNTSIGVILMQYGNAFLNMIIVMMLTKMISIELFGSYIFLGSLNTMISTALFAGGHAIMLRMYSKYRTDSYQIYKIGLNHGIIASIIAIPIMYFSVILSNTELKTISVFVLLLLSFTGVFPTIITQIHNALSKSTGNFTQIKRAEIVGNLFVLCSVSLLYYLAIISVEIIVCIFLLKLTVVMIFALNKTKTKDANIDNKLIRKEFYIGFKSLYVSGIFAYIVTTSDVLMLGYLSNSFELGIYSVPVKIYMILTMLPASINTFLNSKMGDNDFFYSDQYAKYVRLGFSGSFLIVLILLPISNYIILIVADSQYEKSILILQILLIAFIFRTLSYLCASLWLHLEKYKLISKISAINGVTNIILNLIFIPKYGALGAASTSLFSYTIGFIINIVLLAKNKNEKLKLTDYLILKRNDLTLK